ncbi:MAG: SMI1/KNR4 family protein [Akkermansiaceae bacterium]|nr:SMI1/KNR4 family protein [Armatimonadota bacterium]
MTEDGTEIMDRYGDLKSFVTEWHRPIGPSDGNTETEIADTEARLGFRLPEALRELYALVGNAGDITRGHNRFVLLRDLKIEEDWLVIWEENQCVTVMAIHENNLTEENPPVHKLDGDLSGRGWESECLPLNNCVLDMLAYEVMMASEWLAVDVMMEGAIEIPDAEPFLRTKARATPYAVLNDSGYFYLDEVLLYSPGSLEEQIAAKTRDDLLAVMARYEGMCWSYTSLDD